MAFQQELKLLLKQASPYLMRLNKKILGRGGTRIGYHRYNSLTYNKYENLLQGLFLYILSPFHSESILVLSTITFLIQSSFTHSYLRGSFLENSVIFLTTHHVYYTLNSPHCKYKLNNNRGLQSWCFNDWGTMITSPSYLNIIIRNWFLCFTLPNMMWLRHLK